MELLLQIWCRISWSELVMGTSSWNRRVCYVTEGIRSETIKGIEASDSSTCRYRNGIGHEIPTAPACPCQVNIVVTLNSWAWLPLHNLNWWCLRNINTHTFEEMYIYIHPYGPGSRLGILGSTQIGAKCSWQYGLKCSGFARSQISCQDKLGLHGVQWLSLISIGSHCCSQFNHLGITAQSGVHYNLVTSLHQVSPKSFTEVRLSEK
jgi:hypothetical protein